MAAMHAHPSMPAHDCDRDPNDAPSSSPTLTDFSMDLPPQDFYRSSPMPLASSPTLEASLPLPASPEPTSPPVSPPRMTNGLAQHPNHPIAAVNIARGIVMPIRTRLPPRTGTTSPFGEYQHGLPLSVIGEEETTPKRNSRMSTNSQSPERETDRSPTSTTKLAQRLSKRLSGKSDTSQGSEVDLEELESWRPITSRLAADLAAEAEDPRDLSGLESNRNSGVLSDDDDMKRAERILANAKKRLTKMEDNLSKARTSILISPKGSPTMGEHQPAGGLYRSISLGGDRKLGQGAHLKKSKPLYPVVKTMKAIHTRGSSETAVPSSSARFSYVPQVRSASALEQDPSHSIDSMLYEHSPVDKYKDHSPNSASPRSFTTPLKALQEEEDSPTSTDKTSPETFGSQGLGITTEPERRPSLQSSSHSRKSSGASNGLTRSSSAASTRSARELGQQMQGLKARMVRIKSQTNADKVKRQSLHELRTSSPYGQSPEQWYSSAAEYKAGESPLSTNAGQGWSPAQEQDPELETPRSKEDSAFGDMENDGTPATLDGVARTDVNTPIGAQDSPFMPARETHPPMQLSDSGDDREVASSDPEDEVAASEEEQVYLNEVLEESLQEAEPEVPEIPEEILQSNGEPERHEDRYDAFDYENMFLHSALGNYSGNAFHHSRHGSSHSMNSESSDVSVETAKAFESEDAGGEEYEEEDVEEEGEHLAILEYDDLPTPTAPGHPPWVHQRTNSLDSVGTTATFATATEGYSSENESDTVPQEILQWGNRAPLFTSFGGFPNPPTASPILGMQSRANARKASPLATSSSNPSPVERSQSANTTRPSTAPSNPSKLSPHRHSPSQQAATRPANIEILMASLITLADPSYQHRQGGEPFADVDKDLVLALLRSVGAVCSSVLRSEEVYEHRIFRRRLDAARRVLDGDIEVEEE